MIRFIACDLDGTLLNSRKELPDGLKTTVDRLNRRGVVFAPASGRQYFKVREQFEPISMNFMYIAENGAYVVMDGRVIVRDCLDSGTARDVIKRARRMPGVYPVLCCEDSAYVERGGQGISEVKKYYKRLDTVSDLIDYCETKNILKIAIFTYGDAYEEIFKKLPEYTGKAQVIVSGANWVDVMKNGVSKGSAVRKIQQICGYAKDECMCFGDYLNDFEMLHECGESFAMANAHEQLRRAAKHIAPSNDENGVIKVISEWFDL